MGYLQKFQSRFCLRHWQELPFSGLPLGLLSSMYAVTANYTSSFLVCHVLCTVCIAHLLLFVSVVFVLVYTWHACLCVWCYVGVAQAQIMRMVWHWESEVGVKTGF